MNKLSNDELELRKWALEMSIKYGHVFFPQKQDKTSSEIVSNAHRIIELVTSGWDKPIEEYRGKNGFPTLERNP